VKATKVNAGLTESNGRLLLGIWRDSLHVTCGLTACTPGSAPRPTLGNEYGKLYGRGIIKSINGGSVLRRYTLLVGKPPFETSSVRETYARITRNDYRVPSSLSAEARSLINRLLHPDPQCRPSMEQVLHDEFLLSGTAIRHGRSMHKVK